MALASVFSRGSHAGRCILADPEVARAITDAARIVRAGNQRSALELDELVQVGWERVLRYLGRENVSPTLAFVCAKQGMLAAVRVAAGRDRFGRTRRCGDPVFVALDEGREGRDVAVWDQWRRHALPVEEMIDAKRALLGMQLREAMAWYSHHWLGEELGHLTGELGVTEGRIRQLCASARAKLAAVWAGDGFETETERQARLERDQQERAERREAARQHMLAERRARWADLRARGLRGAEARRAAQSATRYAEAVRRLPEGEAA